jgi:hypothetical protein
MAAVNEGWAAGFASSLDPDGLSRVLGMPDEVTLVMVIPIGHHASDKPFTVPERGRIPDVDYIQREQW